MKKQQHHISNESKNDKAVSRKQYMRAYWKEYRKSRKRISTLFSNMQYAFIENEANKKGVSVSKEIAYGYAIYSQLHSDAKILPAEQQTEVIRQLTTQFKRIGNNINQIAREVNCTGNFDEDRYIQYSEELMHYMDILKKIINEYEQ